MNKSTYDSLILDNVQKVMSHKKTGNPIVFLFLVPFIAIQQAILILFGQQPDSFYRAFLDTTEWTFSQFDPPPAPMDGHYLCTIATRGNSTLVRPLRPGKRGGKNIVVNRQLLIANAFEEILEQYTPVFHRLLRRFYNSFGVPLNDMIKQRWFSNVMYLIMKPLEWFFLLVLYLVDKKPENRIVRQYTNLPKFHVITKEN